MKKIVNLIDDGRPGGIVSLLNDMAGTALSTQFDWQVMEVDPCIPIRLDSAVDVIVVHYSMAWRKLPALLQLRRRHRRAKLVVVEHHYTRAFEQRNVKSRRRFRAMLRTCYKLADQVVAVSNAQASWLRSADVVASAKLGTIPSCRDYSRFLAIPRIPKNEGPVVVGGLGRLVQAKGFDVLIEAMRRLPSERFQLKIAGDGDQGPALRELAAGLDNVEFVGHLGDPAPFLAGCDVLAVPSRAEAFGLVCAEAKAAGLPVVVSDIDALPAQAADCGAVVVPDDPDALSNALLAVTKPEKLRRYGERARKSVVNAWSQYLSSWLLVLA